MVTSTRVSTPSSRRTQLRELIRDKPFARAHQLESFLRAGIREGVLGVIAVPQVADQVLQNTDRLTDETLRLPNMVAALKDRVYRDLEDTMSEMSETARSRLVSKLTEEYSEEFLESRHGDATLAELFVQQAHVNVLAEVLVAEILYGTSQRESNAKDNFEQFVVETLRSSLRQLGVFDGILEATLAPFIEALSFTELYAQCREVVTRKIEATDKSFQSGLETSIYEAAGSIFPDPAMRRSNAGRIKNVVIGKLTETAGSISLAVFAEIRKLLAGSEATVPKPAALSPTAQLLGSTAESAPEMPMTTSGLGESWRDLAPTDDDLFRRGGKEPPKKREYSIEEITPGIERTIRTFIAHAKEQLTPTNARSHREIIQSLDVPLRNAMKDAARELVTNGITVDYETFYNAFYSAVYVDLPKPGRRTERINVLGTVENHCYPSTPVKEFMRSQITPILEGGNGGGSR